MCRGLLLQFRLLLCTCSKKGPLRARIAQVPQCLTQPSLPFSAHGSTVATIPSPCCRTGTQKLHRPEPKGPKDRRKIFRKRGREETSTPVSPGQGTSRSVEVGLVGGQDFQAFRPPARSAPKPKQLAAALSSTSRLLHCSLDCAALHCTALHCAATQEHCALPSDHALGQKRAFWLQA